MNSFSPEKEAAAVEQIFELANALNGYRGPNALDYLGPKRARVARAAVRAVAGQPIVGNTSLNFFGFEWPGYRRHGLPYHPNTGNEFRGVVRRLYSLPYWREGQQEHHLCLQVAPLDGLSDPAWQEYYDAHDSELFHHPFAKAELAGKSVWVPLDSMGERLVFFPPDPVESTRGTQRARV